jgi:hypothetical protein
MLPNPFFCFPFYLCCCCYFEDVFFASFGVVRELDLPRCGHLPVHQLLRVLDRKPVLLVRALVYHT